MTKRVLILGAGLVSQPIIDYLLDKTDHLLTVADILPENARKALKDNPRGIAEPLDVSDEAALTDLIEQADLVVSLLPVPLHPIVARCCIATGRSMINASYVSDEISAMDQTARDADVLLLCELGLDPGIDHMSAMQIIQDIRDRNGRIASFKSVCGGLPAPDANDNPFGYKFSWSPLGVLMAGNSSARYFSEGELVELSERELFPSAWPLEIADMEFEAYPNRDSISYKDVYGFKNVRNLLRGTLRNPGWSKLIQSMKILNLLSTDSHGLVTPHSFAEILSSLNGFDRGNLKQAAADKLELSLDDEIIQAMEWLGIFDDTERDWNCDTPVKCTAILMNERMSYAEGERDMIVLNHEFIGEFDDHREVIQSTLVAYGDEQSSSMARTVSLPIAIAVKLFLEGRINFRGIQIPVLPEIYNPILAELAELGIAFEETKQIEAL